MVFGFGYAMEMSIVAKTCLFTTLIFTRAAVQGVEPRLLEVARVLKLSRLASVTKIVLPAALPQIFVAFRLAAGSALIVAVTVEITLNPQGLGFGIMTAQQALRPDLMMVSDLGTPPLPHFEFAGYGRSEARHAALAEVEQVIAEELRRERPLFAVA
eukprot:gene21597-26457_t